MSLVIKKGWYDKLVPLEEQVRARILNDIVMYYFTDIESDFEHEVKDFIIEDIDNKKKPKVIPKWRTDFKEYLSGLNKAHEAILKDAEWISNQRKFYPHVNIEMSLKKAINDFWGTERGWNHKKKSRSSDIDWTSTLTRAIGQSFNQVYLPRGSENNAEMMCVWTYDGVRRKTSKRAYLEDLNAFGKDRVKLIREELA